MESSLRHEVSVCSSKGARRQRLRMAHDSILHVQGDVVLQCLAWTLCKTRAVQHAPMMEMSQLAEFTLMRSGVTDSRFASSNA